MRAVVMVFASAAGVADASWLRRRKTSLVAWRRERERESE